MRPRLTQSSRPALRASILKTICFAAAMAGLSGCAVFDRLPTINQTTSTTGAGVTAAGPIPRGGGYEMVGRPYEVAGRTYVPQEDPNYSRTGVASWYGADFHGELTANGELYDMTALTAAHPTLPLPSYVRVTNLDNGSSLVVRVNDRGPFVAGRLIDLSAQAANMLGFMEEGTAHVQVDYIGRAALEGDDTRMLMATYLPPGGTAETMIAYNATTHEVAVEAAGPIRRAFNPFLNGAAEAIFRPTAVPRGEDPLAALMANPAAYAPAEALSPAQRALQDMANAGLRTNATAATETLLQIGVFSDRTNADRIADLLGAFGLATITELEGPGQPMWSVRLSVLPQNVEAAVIAAIDAGATGAHPL
jgi:rare lipoprotein A